MSKRKNPEVKNMPSAPLKGAEFSTGKDKKSENKSLEKKSGNKSQEKKERGNFFKKLGKGLKEVFGELKKVTWAPLPKAFKQTGIVIGVVVLFLLVLGGIDALLAWLFRLLTKTY